LPSHQINQRKRNQKGGKGPFSSYALEEKKERKGGKGSRISSQREGGGALSKPSKKRCATKKKKKRRKRKGTTVTIFHTGRKGGDASEGPLEYHLIFERKEKTKARISCTQPKKSKKIGGQKKGNFPPHRLM